ncbi:hypothetical protein [Mesorhizobium sp. J428]|jgi:hypothetical protein|uniref:hypothetical protein n=1 Tax=Mesorhizobium sp. J428 TaxID=2898440 RepID=UPI0021513BC8|nr:hypothetical protein [Mesorhizobium sp. J428]MCR5858953.1 hypothetical protein [Mesorhizobium sp. J428]
MTTYANPIADIVRMLPRLALIALFIGSTALAVSKVNAAPEAIVTDVMLVGGQIAKPSGVGFVLAVGLQRMR